MNCAATLPILLAAAAVGCAEAPLANQANAATANAATANATAQPTPAVEQVTLRATDGVAVFGSHYSAAAPRALILLFHQAESNRAEYREIAPRLAAAGYSALAIDQRAGGERFGARNATVDALGGSADFPAARADLEAALAWGATRRLPVILWGSSYSSALIFPVAAARPQGVAALLAFSPGEYIGEGDPVRAAAGRLTVPVFLTSASDPAEIAAVRPIHAALRGATKVHHVPAAGVHGSSTLIAEANAEGAEANWSAVLAFLQQVSASPR